VLQSTHHEKILLARHREFDWQRLTEILDGMVIACKSYDETQIRGLLSELVPEWSGFAAERQEIVTRPAKDAANSVAEKPVLH
jgi:FlaA1/EpsC-like NDP-sugar epimerase